MAKAAHLAAFSSFAIIISCCTLSMVKHYLSTLGAFLKLRVGFPPEPKSPINWMITCGPTFGFARKQGTPEVDGFPSFSISFNGHWISRYFGIHHCNGFVWNHDTPFHPLITHHCEHCQKSIPFLEKSIFLGFFICFHHFSPSYPSWVTGLCSLSRPLLARFGPPAALFVTEESEPPGFFWDSVA